MRIGIDGRLIEETGVGRYIRNLTTQLSRLDKHNEYVVFLRRKSYQSFRPPNIRWNKVLADVPWHSVTEQLTMPGILTKANLDLLHVPYFNVPIFYPGRMIATIHDLTILHFDTGKATTLPWVLYKLRRAGYRLVLWAGLMRVKKIIAVSNTTKKDIVQSLGVDPSKIIVTYEGVDIKKTNDKRLIQEPYFLYVGNAYPHKNLEILLDAVKQLQTKLVLVGKEDYFYRRLHVTPITVTDRELASLYIHAKALIFPSLMEGFGLPALEALSVGCPVICSDIPVFHEILGDAATFFDPMDPDDLVKKLKSDLPRAETFLDKKYSWEIMAKQTLDVYESSARL